MLSGKTKNLKNWVRWIVLFEHEYKSLSICALFEITHENSLWIISLIKNLCESKLTVGLMISLILKIRNRIVKSLKENYMLK
jgi:hypothetical protein